MVKTIYMGQLDTVRSPDILKTTLGSCVGVVLYDPQTDVFGMAHIMLPKADGRGEMEPSGKYANTAIPALIAQMGTPPQFSNRLRAKVAGGANMFASLRQTGDQDILRVGGRNIEATLDLMFHLGIQILGKELGGGHGRELTIDAKTGKVWVRAIGGKPREF